MTTNKHFYIDASMLRDWGVCREYFRRRWMENKVSRIPAIHREFGIAVHIAVEHFWLGGHMDSAYALAHSHMSTVSEDLMDYVTRKKWEGLKDALPACLTVYYNHHVQDTDSVASLELEWELPLKSSKGRVTIVGRKDREMKDNTLYDTKTASEIGEAYCHKCGEEARKNLPKDWKKNYTEQMLRDPGLPLYDWHSRQVGDAPSGLFLDVIIKPYGNKGSRVELIDMKNLMSHRKRFDEQLEFDVAEMVHYMDTYYEKKPWPMNPGIQCVNKYGRCDYLPLCNWDSSEKNLKLYMPRVEHLEVRK